jgi:surface polysaccharide O-acyltransferase-like enzyme
MVWVIKMIKKRKTFLDVLRVMAAISVALYHVLTSSTNLDPVIPQLTRDFVTALSNVLLWHVPTFLLITGFLWLSDERECTYAKVLPGVRRYVLVLFTVGLAYALMERFFDTRTVSVGLFLGAVKDVLTGNLWVSMWYVYAVIGIYLSLPLLKPYFQHSSIKNIGILTGLFFVFGVITPTVEEAFGYQFPISFPVANPAYPAFYICAGGLLSKLTLPRKAAVIGLLTFFLSSGCAFTFAWLFPAKAVCVIVFSAISAISLFVAVKIWVEDAPEIPWLRCVADCSFGIYLFHQLAINVMIKLLHIYPLQKLPLLSVPCALLGVVAVSLGITYLLRKIPWVRKYIL